MNQNPETFIPPLLKLPGKDVFYLGDANALLLHDFGQLINSLWLDQLTIQRTQVITKFYIDLKNLVRANVMAADGPSANRLVLNALHDSQRGLHSFMLVLIWLIQKPEGLLPSVDQVQNFGPINNKDLVTHLIGMGVRSSKSVLQDDASDHAKRSWLNALPTQDGFTLLDGLEFVINRDRYRAAGLATALAEIPGVAELYQQYVTKGAFDFVSKEELAESEKQMRWRYENMGNN